MSASAALQVALIAALRADADVSAFLGDRIWDNAPVGAEYPYLTLGPSQELDGSAECIDASECYQQIDIWTQEGGSQLTAKQICGAVKRRLHFEALDLAEPYALTVMTVDDLRVMGDPDDQIAHGIVSVRALVEG